MLAASAGAAAVRTASPARFPTTRHPELAAPAVPRAEGSQQRFDLAAQVGLHAHAPALQRQPQGLRNGGAQQHLDAEFDHAAREVTCGEHAENELLSLHFAAAPPGAALLCQSGEPLITA